MAKSCSDVCETLTGRLKGIGIDPTLMDTPEALLDALDKVVMFKDSETMGANGEERAFLCEIFPCNALPFLTRIRQLLQEGNTNAFDSLSEKAKVNVRACMWILMAQLYGQFAVLDLNHEWLELEATIKGGD